MDDDGAGLVVGLGNPGERYRLTRHNLGFVAVERLAAELGAGRKSLECNALVARAGDLWLAWPQTYMNRSGYSVRCLVERHDIARERLLVVYDEIDLPLGRMRLRRQGSPAGHRGMESVIRSLASREIARLRIGVAPADGSEPAGELSDYVLEPFCRDEREAAAAAAERAAEACVCWWREGAQEAMNRFNG